MNGSVKSKPRVYAPEVKERAVRMVLALRAETGEKHGTVKRVADQLNIGVESLRSWVHQHEIDHGERSGMTTVDAARMKQLEQENRELRRANEILKADLGFLCGGVRPPAEVVVAFIDNNRGDLGVEPIWREIELRALKTLPLTCGFVSEARYERAPRRSSNDARRCIPAHSKPPV